MKKINKTLTVIDFFCGAGGFSEGFRQQGFKIIKGLDFWQPAIDSHNLNHNLNDTTKNILDFWSEDSLDVSEIEKLEDSEIIIGSPSCVSFSTSNKWGKADKSLGIQLIEAYLRVIAVKKHKKNSKLLAWYMENVPNSRNYVEKEYSFEKLNLGKWAKKNGKKPSDIALRVKENGDIINSGDYGAPQSRDRFIAGEWCETGEFLNPIKTHKTHVSLGEILKKIPKPNSSKNYVNKKYIVDPNYKNLKILGTKFTDHFYDTGLYKIEWEKAEYLKTYNYCMGKMSFPENLDKPCRTIMATRSASTREALILKSEYNRKGDGEYRLPTIREIAILMGFPIVYQFVGSEGVKWRQIGNAVSPHVSNALAKAIRKKIGLEEIINLDFSNLKKNYDKVNNLNTFKENLFNNPKKRLKGAKFRRPILKKNNITIDLLNYNDNGKVGKKWYIKAFFGTGINFKQIEIEKKHIKQLEEILEDKIENFSQYKVDLKKFFKEEIGKIDINKLQSIYEEDLYIRDSKNPINIRNRLNKFIQEKVVNDDFIKGVDFIPKDEISKSHLLTIYSLGNLIFNG